MNRLCDLGEVQKAPETSSAILPPPHVHGPIHTHELEEKVILYRKTEPQESTILRCQSRQTDPLHSSAEITAHFFPSSNTAAHVATQCPRKGDGVA